MVGRTKALRARRVKPAAQGELWKPRGGKRPNAGRPKQPGRLRASERHVKRPRLLASDSSHVVCRAVPGLPNLRTRAMWLAIREATIVVAKFEDFRIVHASVQRTHVHLIVEAEN